MSQVRRAAVLRGVGGKPVDVLLEPSSTGPRQVADFVGASIRRIHSSLMIGYIILE
ncbi:MAG: hypothetical protein LBF72_02810 [Holosporales bacterium]|nr:hypothetical protein [Holosporales bacterium]